MTIHLHIPNQKLRKLGLQFKWNNYYFERAKNFIKNSCKARMQNRIAAKLSVFGSCPLDQIKL